ncbi:MAG: hypothetical protein JRJ00_00820 [Deltaproteobacteria bacterium]|nr:hypothetical protein [Deltaproteobacteria bacterium]
MNYDALIKRAKKAIEVFENKETPSAVHKVDVDTDISKLSGLVVILHPDTMLKKMDT